MKSLVTGIFRFRTVLLGVALGVSMACALSLPAWADTITLTGTIRDFKGTGEPGGHPDFEDGVGSGSGIVSSTLGADDKPVYVGPPGNGATHGATAFNQWYNDSPPTNMTGSLDIELSNGGGPPGGIYSFSDSTFFPIDGALFGDTPGESHNFHFTYELHTTFTYQGGEVFSFTGDDDIWVFINKNLAVDLGGVHGAASGSVDLDSSAGALGISTGNSYAFDFFYAERHTSESNFLLSTSIVLDPNPPTSVPEPASLLLLGSGLAGLVAWRVRKK